MAYIKPGKRSLADRNSMTVRRPHLSPCPVCGLDPRQHDPASCSEKWLNKLNAEGNPSLTRKGATR